MARLLSPERRRAIRRVALGIVLATLLVLLYRAPGLFVLNAWRFDEYYTHGALVALVAVGLAAWRLRAEPRAPRDPVAWHMLGVPVAAALYLVGFLRHSPYLMAWSALALAMGIALATGGPARVRRLAAPFLLVALALPVPWIGDLGIALQDGAFRASTWTLALVGVPLVAGLTTFAVGDLAFEVTAACSGFQSAVSLLAVGALVVALFPMGAKRRRVVLLAAVPLALLLNVARILAVVGIGLAWGPEAAERFFHDASSLVLFAVETVVLLGIAGVLRKPAPEVDAPAQA